MLSLAKGQISCGPYMGDEKVFTHLTFVIADDMEQARSKYKAYWEAKTSKYGISMEIMETIT